MRIKHDWVKKNGELYADLTEKQQILADTPGFQLNLSVYRRNHALNMLTAPGLLAGLNQALQKAYEQDMEPPTQTSSPQG
ncbi:MAG: hypothetical protein K0U37_05970 [Gammaproteobacteria bacterium]|nr:hypothetical protein [Gammaproteobacteria bacterium]